MNPQQFFLNLVHKELSLEQLLTFCKQFITNTLPYSSVLICGSSNTGRSALVNLLLGLAKNNGLVYKITPHEVDIPEIHFENFIVKMSPTGNIFIKNRLNSVEHYQLTLTQTFDPENSPFKPGWFTTEKQQEFMNYIMGKKKSFCEEMKEFQKIQLEENLARCIPSIKERIKTQIRENPRATKFDIRHDLIFQKSMIEMVIQYFENEGFDVCFLNDVDIRFLQGITISFPK